MKSANNKRVARAGKKSTKSKNPKSLGFKCPKCGCETLLEHASIWRQIVEVRRPSGPHDAHWCPDPSIVYDEEYFFSHDYGEHNLYCCEDCDAILEDEEGNPGWGAEFLYQWLLSH